RVLRVGDRLALGRRADEDLAVVRVADDRRRGARALGVLDDLGLAAFHDGNAAVRRPEVDADDLAHCRMPLRMGLSGRGNGVSERANQPPPRPSGALATLTSAGRSTRSLIR